MCLGDGCWALLALILNKCCVQSYVPASVLTYSTITYSFNAYSSVLLHWHYMWRFFFFLTSHMGLCEVKFDRLCKVLQKSVESLSIALHVFRCVSWSALQSDAPLIWIRCVWAVLPRLMTICLRSVFFLFTLNLSWRSVLSHLMTSLLVSSQIWSNRQLTCAV